MIDLYTERYTVSEIIKQEYDTTVKDKAKPIVKSNATNKILINKIKGLNNYIIICHNKLKHYFTE